MSPTVFKYKNYRFFFFSREEERMHVHVYSSEGEAKFWLEPVIALERYHNLSTKQIKELERVIKKRENEIKSAWQKHFQS